MKRNFVGDDILFRKLIENSSSGITLFDSDFNIIYRSPSVERINGWSEADRIKSTLSEIVHPLDRPRVEIVFKEVLNSPGEPKTVRFRSKHFLGHYIWLECIFTNMFHIQGIKAIVCNSLDISDKVQADTMLQRTIKELSAYKYALDESSIIAISDENGIIRHVNHNFCEVSKYSREELIGQHHDIINYSQHDDNVKNDIRDTIGKGKIWKGELKNEASDGNYYWVDTTVVPFLNQKGKPYRYVNIRSDITERKLSEERIIESERFIKTLTDNLPAMVAYWTADLRCLFANKAYTAWFGKPNEEMRGVDRNDLMEKDHKDFGKFAKHIEGVLQGESQSFENSIDNPDGSITYFHIHYLPDKKNGKIKGYYSFVYDITETKNVELEIEIKNNQINDILETITDGFIALDENLCYTYANKQIGKMLNLDPKSMIGKYVWDLFPEAVGSDTYHAINQAIKEKRFIDNEDYFAPLNLWQENRIYPAGRGVSIFIRDITRYKEEQVEKQILAAAVTESLKERNTILESIADAFFAVDKNWVITYWNKMSEKVLGKTKEEVTDKTLWDIFPEIVDTEFYKNYHIAVQNNKSVHFEAFYQPMDTWYEVSAYPSVTGLSVYFKDVKERKTLEINLKNLNESLEKSQKKYSDLFQLSPLPMWVFDLDTLSFLDVNMAAIQNYGYTKDEFLAMTIKDIRPKSELTKLEKAIDRSNEYNNFSLKGIFIHKKKNGETIQVDIKSNSIEYKDKIAKVVLANDVTDRLNYIKAIEKQNENLLEISWLQSHVIRAPLARIMGLVPLIKKVDATNDENDKMLDYLALSANELDYVIKDITDKTVDAAYKIVEKNTIS